jgi:hypothetical protein
MDRHHARRLLDKRSPACFDAIAKLLKVVVEPSPRVVSFCNSRQNAKDRLLARPAR